MNNDYGISKATVNIIRQTPEGRTMLDDLKSRRLRKANLTGDTIPDNIVIDNMTLDE